MKRNIKRSVVEEMFEVVEQLSDLWDAVGEKIVATGPLPVIKNCEHLHHGFIEHLLIPLLVIVTQTIDNDLHHNKCSEARCGMHAMQCTHLAVVIEQIQVPIAII